MISWVEAAVIPVPLVLLVSPVLPVPLVLRVSPVPLVLLVSPVPSVPVVRDVLPVPLVTALASDGLRWLSWLSSTVDVEKGMPKPRAEMFGGGGLRRAKTWALVETGAGKG